MQIFNTMYSGVDKQGLGTILFFISLLNVCLQPWFCVFFVFVVVAIYVSLWWAFHLIELFLNEKYFNFFFFSSIQLKQFINNLNIVWHRIYIHWVNFFVDNIHPIHIWIRVICQFFVAFKCINRMTNLICSHLKGNSMKKSRMKNSLIHNSVDIQFFHYCSAFKFQYNINIIMFYEVNLSILFARLNTFNMNG